MAYRLDQNSNELVIDGFEKGIAHSPYTGIANIRNLNNTYYPGVAYVNYRRQACSLTDTGEDYWFAGTHSINVSNNDGWFFSGAPTMANPVQNAQSPAGLNYILDSLGQIWKQTSVNSSSFNLLANGAGRVTNGAGGLAYWNNYLVVFGNGYIEFCGNGTGDSGIVSTNWNLSSPATTVNILSQYWQQSNTGIQVYAWTGTVSTSATSATLTTNWLGVSGSYPVRFDNSGMDVRTVTFTNGSTSATWSGGLTGNASTDFFMYQFNAVGGSFQGYELFASGQQVSFTSSGTLPGGVTAGTLYYLTSSVDLTGNLFFTFSATSGGENIQPTSAGTGTLKMILGPSISPPIYNTVRTDITWGTFGVGSTTATLASNWLQASGTYNVVDPLGNNLLAQFTFESNTINFISPSDVQPLSGNFDVNILNPAVTNYRTYVSKVDGNLYFANGSSMGFIELASANMSFNPGNPFTYNVSYSVFALATAGNVGYDSIVDMTDLQSTMVVAGQNNIYTWDYTSPFTSAPVPIAESIVRIINLLNNVYVLAGQKGNIYVSNGSYAQLLMKIPDYIAGVIDPVWTYGGIMTHRSRVYFQALAQNTSGNNLLQGIFSIVVSPSVLGEVTEGVVMEAQNSNGLIPASGTTGAGILIDDEPSGSGQDSYYNVYSTGASTGTVDYNDTTLWQGFEPVIETDIIPVGTFLDKKTLGQLQFKLDRPMASGDQIRVYARASLSDPYTLMGTTTTTQLSDAYPLNLAQSQWIQFEIQFKCASSSSSFIPLREVRIQLMSQ